MITHKYEFHWLLIASALGLEKQIRESELRRSQRLNSEISPEDIQFDEASLQECYRIISIFAEMIEARDQNPVPFLENCGLKKAQIESWLEEKPSRVEIRRSVPPNWKKTA